MGDSHVVLGENVTPTKKYSMTLKVGGGGAPIYDAKLSSLFSNISRSFVISILSSCVHLVIICNSQKKEMPESFHMKVF